MSPVTSRARDLRDQVRGTTRKLQKSLTLADCENGGDGSGTPLLPRQWPIWKKVTTSMLSLFPVVTIMYTTTSLSTAVPTVPALFATSKTLATLSFSIPFLGMTSAPLYAPYLSERYGRKPVLLVYFVLYGAVVLGLTFAHSIGVLLLLRFLIGLLGGPCIVLAEGTLSQLWPPQRRMTYYAVLAFTQYVGAAGGWLVGVVILQVFGWPYLSFTALLYTVLTLLTLFFLPETSVRKILKRHREAGDDAGRWWTPAVLGATAYELFMEGVWQPLGMLFTDPIVIMCSIYLALNYAIIFQFFISGPQLLKEKFGFTFAETSLAFGAMIAGAMVSLGSIITKDLFTTCMGPKDAFGRPKVENRLLPAFLGGVMLACAVFGIGFTVNTRGNFKLVLVGVAFLTWGTMDILVALVSYVSDAYSRQYAVTALTAMAFSRYFAAGTMPVFALKLDDNIPTKTLFAGFGGMATLMLSVPVVLFFFGERLRQRSGYGSSGDNQDEQDKDEEDLVEQWKLGEMTDDNNKS